MKISWTTISSCSKTVGSGSGRGKEIGAASTTTSSSATTKAGASTSNDKETDDGGNVDVHDGSSIVVSKGSCIRCGKVMANRMCKLCQVSSYCSKECYR